MNRKSRPCRSAGKVALFSVFLVLLLSALAQAQHSTFAIVSDSHVGAANSVYPAFVHIIEEEKIGMVIHAGDAINTPGSTKEWTSFLQITGSVELHLAPGNHDIHGSASYSVYSRYFPKPYYSFSEGDTLFILLNTELPGEESMIGGEQFAWLKKELERHFRYKFVFLHEPLFPVVMLHGLDRHASERDRLHRLFVESRVNLVVAGHDHIYNRTVRDGIIYVIAGPTGGFLPPFPKENDPFRYMIAVRKSDDYSFSVKDMAGNRRDEFSVGTAAAKVPHAD